MKTTIFYCFMALAAISLSACSAEDGATGPAGPQGEQGIPGKDGNANVTYSDWINIDWNTTDEQFIKEMLIDEDKVNKEFLDKGGVVLMYLKQILATDEFIVVPLPHISNNQKFSFILANVPSVTASEILVQAASLNGTTSVSEDYDNGDYSIRYILVPDGTPLSSPESRSLEDVDLSNYQAVADYLELID